MVTSRVPLPVNPGKGLGFLVLGASLHDVLTRLKAQPHLYRTIDVFYSSSNPLVSPVILNLPYNGLRLRFDGPDQRLRLIEVLDFTKISLTYKNIDLVKPLEDALIEDGHLGPSTPTGPAFRQVYHKMFGPTFAGEYLATYDDLDSTFGTYVLSYPGVALTFPLRDSAWAGNADFVSLLSSSAALPAKSLTIFNGSSWKEARKDLFTRPCPHPRSLALGGGRAKEGIPDEIEFMKICGNGHIEVLRRSSAPFHLYLNETTTQDLVAEFGPPDAIYRKNDRRLSIHKTYTRSRSTEPHHSPDSPAQVDGVLDPEQASTSAITDDSDVEDTPPAVSTHGNSMECFYNYFHHGFDAFVSFPTFPSPGLALMENQEDEVSTGPSTNRLVVTKILLHGNIPGSYPFNRYRRSRWFLDLEKTWMDDTILNSETPFTALSSALKDIWKDTYANQEQAKSLQRAMVLNRGWGDSPGSSCELLGGWEDSTETGKKCTGTSVTDSASGLGNTELFGFPGFLFEVLKNDTVSCLTVY